MIRPLIITFMLTAAQLQAEPLLSIAGTMDASGDYGLVLDALEDVAADATNLTLFWDLMEKDGDYSADPDWPTIANTVYPNSGLQVTLMISVIDSVADRRPAELMNKPFSDPQVIARFETFLTNVLTRMPKVTLTSIGIGNEVDGYLDGNSYDEYAVFFAAASEAANRLAPGVPVGTVVTWNGLVANPRAQALADLGDVWMINHYPLTPEFRVKPPDTITATLADMGRLAGLKPVMLTETGYPSAGCGATTAGQRDYIDNVMSYANAHPDAMPLVTLVWLHDLSREEVTGYVDYYDITDTCFADYLASLGLRTRNGRDKPAFGWLRDR